ncbi:MULTISPECIES: hypothetical protein [Pseudomonas]|uniref:Uncharacterized protein n=1 Tax=Pseudomonas donghuensis TaxID=1163398 RepID=A0AAP0X9T1_9PSED|nr:MULTISPECIES: hypothetical protein [Pseudomonas]MDF9896119.1 hypothetical protein [Pseudomonas vranovensis]KDN99787.1 hypothetical protein BV82_2200 [Pseudomonas donghuensis]MBF4209312.1 hypothetical protein [Pseudomonas donghuensis]MBS7598537.1 hypothetical protein [Pseudomonas sp. RC2C2]MCP6690227.1 hypothetical protein [Pseudomonas donghuensis]
MTRRWLIALVAHALACLLFLLLNDIGVDYYKQVYGGFTARGVASGAIVWLVFDVMVIFSLVIAHVPQLKHKLMLNAALVALIIYWLMPDHPVRTMFFSPLAGGLTLLAILITHWLGPLPAAKEVQS